MLSGDLDGTQAAQQIHGRFNIPIVFLTANADENILDRARMAEPYGYIVKPFKDIQVRAAIEMALHKCKMEAELQSYRDHLEELVEGRTCELKDANERHQQEFAGRMELEEQLSHAQKMESVGRLAGGVAHDFNNLLTAIMGYSQMSLREAPSKSPISSHLQDIQEATVRAAKLTNQLLAFSRHQVIEPKVIDLNDLIINLDKMLRRLIGEDIELVTLPAANLQPVKADPGQIE